MNHANGSMLVGMFGIKWFLMALSDNDHIDLAFASVMKKTFPSYGYMLESNATTIWESWFFSDNTFSHDHPMFGTGEVFLMQALGGIQPHPAARGFDRVLLKPKPPSALPSFGARFSSARGEIAVEWRWGAWSSANSSVVAYDGGPGLRRRLRTLRLEVKVPPNVEAEVHVPSTEATRVSIDLGIADSDRRVDQSLRGASREVDATAGATSTVFHRGSGVHRFSSWVLAWAH